MRDTTVKKVSSAHPPKGEMGQTYLASGQAVSMRLWEEEPGDPKPETERGYETVGYVIAGRAELHLEGRCCRLAWRPARPGRRGAAGGPGADAAHRWR